MTLLKEITITPSSENTVLIVWPEKICPKQHQSILAVQTIIIKQLGNAIFESIVSYNSLMIYYHFEQLHFIQLKQLIVTILSQVNEQIQTKKNDTSNDVTIEIPVYYSEEAGWDLANVAKECRLSIQEVIKLHSEVIYHAYALGFTPGFCYLGTLSQKLRLARKSIPRMSIPKGAVAIAEQQTAVYPTATPGGWHIIGQTPIEMFSIVNESFTPKITVGQQVTFNAIDKQTFLSLGGSIYKEQSLRDQQSEN